MSDDQIRSDLATILGLLRDVPTREELSATESRILAQISSLGTSIATHVGGVLQRVETLEGHRVEADKDNRKNGKHKRPAVVR